ncbi:MAG: NUDIX hydrolase [Arachnia sp.]
MSKRPEVLAAGGVVLRTHHGTQQLLLIHRERYDDWSLPKGKGRTDEQLPMTATREIREETGVDAILGLRLPAARYPVNKGMKSVHYWRASVRRQRPRKPDAEVSAVRWFAVDEALDRLSYDDERVLVETALTQPATTALLLVRHAKAMLRKNWTGDDDQRRLSGRGRRQAEAIADVFEAFGVERLVSSPARRCVDTLKPYAKLAKLKVEEKKSLTEASGTKRPGRARKLLAGLREDLSRPTAVCGHRPVLPAMLDGLGQPPRPMVTAEIVAHHFAADGALVRSEVLKPTA